MRAAVMLDVGKELSVENVTAVDGGRFDVRVSVQASGVCGSDLSVLSGRAGAKPPLILGHECVGIVDAVGDAVTTVSLGDRVVLCIAPACGMCSFCVQGDSHLCATAGPLRSRVKAHLSDGRECLATAGLGTFAESVVAHETTCVRVQTDVSSEELALVGCGLLTGVGAVVNTARVHPGATVAVIGSGGVGQAVIQGARIAGAGVIIAIDPVAEKREAARLAGATDVCDPATSNVIDSVRELTGGIGVDFAFEVVGRPSLMKDAYELTRRGGTTVFVGIPGAGASFEFPARSLISDGKSIKGSYYGSSQIRRDIPRLLRLIEAGQLNVENLISNRLKLDDINSAFDALVTGAATRSVVIF